jgi:TonB family protein
MEEGHTVVVFKVDRNGNILSSDIKQSSGNEVFDGSALEALNKAAPFGEFPSNSNRYCITVMYSFDSSIVDTTKMKEYVENSEKYMNIDKRVALEYIDKALKEIEGKTIDVVNGTKPSNMYTNEMGKFFGTGSLNEVFKTKYVPFSTTDSADAILKAKAENKKKIDDLVQKSSSIFKQLDEQLKEIEDSGEKGVVESKNKSKSRFNEEKEKIKNQKRMKKSITKSNVKPENLEEEIKKQKEEIQELERKKMELRNATLNNKNEVDFYEMNLGQLLFSDEVKREIQKETSKFQNEYNEFYRQKMEQFAQYRNDPQLNKFLQLAQTNPMMYNYIIPQIWYEFLEPYKHY